MPFMKEAIRSESDLVARLLNVNRDVVWKIIKGMKYSSHTELALAVHKAFSL